MATTFSKAGTRTLAWITALAFSLAATIIFAAPASATKPVVVPPGFFEYDLEPGQRCEFATHYVVGGGVFVEKATTDENGNLLQEHSSGKTNAFTITNPDNQKSIIIDSKGFSETVTYNADGSITTETSGQAIYELYPSDTPAGPALYVTQGRVVGTITPEGNFILTSVVGQTVDVCQAIS